MKVTTVLSTPPSFQVSTIHCYRDYQDFPANMLPHRDLRGLPSVRAPFSLHNAAREDENTPTPTHARTQPTALPGPSSPRRQGSTPLQGVFKRLLQNSEQDAAEVSAARCSVSNSGSETGLTVLLPQRTSDNVQRHFWLSQQGDREFRRHPWRRGQGRS